MSKKIGIREMQKFFKEHNLLLGRPMDSKSGEIVTDWKLHYHGVSYEDSDLLKFTTLIEEKYSEEFELWGCGMNASIGIRRKK